MPDACAMGTKSVRLGERDHTWIWTQRLNSTSTLTNWQPCFTTYQMQQNICQQHLINLHQQDLNLNPEDKVCRQVWCQPPLPHQLRISAQTSSKHQQLGKHGVGHNWYARIWPSHQACTRSIASIWTNSNTLRWQTSLSSCAHAAKFTKGQSTPTPMSHKTRREQRRKTYAWKVILCNSHSCWPVIGCFLVQCMSQHSNQLSIMISFWHIKDLVQAMLEKARGMASTSTWLYLRTIKAHPALLQLIIQGSTNPEGKLDSIAPKKFEAHYQHSPAINHASPEQPPLNNKWQTISRDPH